MKDENVRVAWNAAYWLLRSEARRQVESKFPDCDWKMVETHDECVTTIIEAQAKICMDAMRGKPALSIAADRRESTNPFPSSGSQIG